MSKIRRLPTDLANQIAAGEVVERPASVVKELIENALDAAARRVTVSVEAGGKRRIRVEDDGEGMTAEDARLAIERHATSKIAKAADLEHIVTLGFRGEALPSIASVSKFLLRTRARGAQTGTEVRVDGGVTTSIKEVGAPEGTTVEVEALFYNLPARRKFLKSDAGETGQISRIVTQIALGYPEIGFTLTSGPRTLLRCPPTTGMSDRFFQIHGERPDLIEVGTEVGGLRLTGYAAALTDQGAVRGPQHVFVNRRVVKDRTIGHAVSQAYADATIKERSPEVHLFLEVPSARVDVNVHPTKAEVRFLDQSLVHEVVRRGVSDALGGGRTPELRVRPAGLTAEPAAQTLPDVLAGGTFTSRWAATTAAVARSNVPGGAAPTPRSVVDGSPAPVDSAMSGAEIRPMIPLGQFRDTFIIAIDDEGISIIDQHVAHERVLFEQIMERLTAERMESQRLLVPIVLQLPAPQREGLAAHADDLGRFGFEIDLFGGDSVRLVATPAVLDQASIETVVRTLAEDLEGLDRGLSVEERLKRIAATTACHAAVKANDPLTMEQMTHILAELRRTAYSSVCPHGRPVVLRLTRREIEKNFQRI